MYWLDVRRLRRGEYVARREAALRLGSSKKRRALRPLVAAVEGSDGQEPLAAAAHALGTLGDRRAIGPLVAALANGNMPMFEAAHDALERIDPQWPATEEARRAVPLLVQALDERLERMSRSSSPQARETAAETRQRIAFQERQAHRLIDVLGRIDGRPAEQSLAQVFAGRNRDILAKVLGGFASEVEESTVGRTAARQGAQSPGNVESL